mgnify:CR=1 FL=1
MAENNNNGGKNTNIITKINDTISKVLGDFPPVVQTIAKIVVFGGLILLIAKAIGYIFPVIVNVLFNLLVKIVGFCILAAFLYGCWYEVKLQMTRDENSFLLNERLKYQKKESEARERRSQERDNRRYYIIIHRLSSFGWAAFFVFLLQVLANRIPLNL